MNLHKMKKNVYGYPYDFYKTDEIKRTRNVRELFNEQESHIFSGSKIRFTLPRGRVMQRLLELDGL